MTIDAHHHFWHFDPEKYAWIDDRMEVLKRDFTADDLADAIAGIVDGVVSVQARADLDETQWLLDEAHATPFVLGVVGWVPLQDDDLERHLERFTAEPSLVGIRHPLQDEPDDDFMLRAEFNRGVEKLTACGLAYDILIYERHLANTIPFVDRHPNQVFVLDHLGKPRIESGELEPWRENVRLLAERANCYCKISGMVTEAAWTSWTPDDLRPYLDTILDAFGPQRVMFGSDWPVCLLAASYSDWYRTVADYVSGLSRSEQAWIWGRTAEAAYRLR